MLLPEYLNQVAPVTASKRTEETSGRSLSAGESGVCEVAVAVANLNAGNGIPQ